MNNNIVEGEMLDKFSKIDNWSNVNDYYCQQKIVVKLLLSDCHFSKIYLKIWGNLSKKKENLKNINNSHLKHNNNSKS